MIIGKKKKMFNSKINFIFVPHPNFRISKSTRGVVQFAICMYAVVNLLLVLVVGICIFLYI